MATGARGASMPLYSTLTMLVTLSYPGGSTPGVWPSTETLPFHSGNRRVVAQHQFHAGGAVNETSTLGLHAEQTNRNDILARLQTRSAIDPRILDPGTGTH